MIKKLILNYQITNPNPELTAGVFSPFNTTELAANKLKAHKAATINFHHQLPVISTDHMHIISTYIIVKDYENSLNKL